MRPAWLNFIKAKYTARQSWIVGQGQLCKNYLQIRNVKDRRVD